MTRGQRITVALALQDAGYAIEKLADCIRRATSDEHDESIVMDMGVARATLERAVDRLRPPSEAPPVITEQPQFGASAGAYRTLLVGLHSEATAVLGAMRNGTTTVEHACALEAAAKAAGVVLDAEKAS